MAKSNDDLRNIPLNQVRPNEVALRKVNKESEKFIGMVDSVRQRGILNPVVVREVKDSATGSKFWALIDGLHRYTAAVEAGLDTIPAHIVTADEADILEMQIIGNIHKVETKPAEYSQQLTRLLALHPTMTAIELANKLGKSITWINDRLGLVNLTEPIQDLVDKSQISVTNACNLAKLPPEEQSNFLDRSMTMSPTQFVPTVIARIKEIKDAKRQGRAASGEKEFIPPVFLQKLSTIKQEINDMQVGRSLFNQYGLTTAEDGWKMALNWTLHLDPISIELAKQKEEERKRQAQETKEQKKAEREAKKQREALTVVAGISEDEEEDE